MVKLLIDKNADAIAIQNRLGETAVHITALRNHDILMMLIKKNKDAAVLKDCAGDTALHWAAESGRETTVKVLVEECPDLVSIRNLKGETALQSYEQSQAGTNLSESTLKLLSMSPSQTETQ